MTKPDPQAPHKRMTTSSFARDRLAASPAAHPARSTNQRHRLTPLGKRGACNMERARQGEGGKVVRL